MSDWEIDNSAQQSMVPSSSDWEVETPMEETEKKIGFGQALAQAPSKIYEDISGGVKNFIENVPNYYQSAKTEVPGLFSTAKQHPLHLLLQALAGSQEGINSLAQFPSMLAKYGANRLNLLPQSVPSAIQKFSPEDTSKPIQQLFDKPKYPGESLTRGAVKIGTEFLGGKSIPEGISSGVGLASKAANPLTSKLPSITSKGIAKDIIIRPHDILEKKAASGFKKVSDEVNKRGINKIPVSEKNIVFYHGTDPKNTKNIFEKGLTSKDYGDKYPTLADSSEAAENYGSRKMGDVYAEPNIIKISIPESKIDEYIHPEVKNAWMPRGTDKSKIYPIKKTIPPEYIHDISKDIIEKNKLDKNEILSLSEYFPKTKESKELINKASNGDYNALRKVQSELYTRGKKNLGSDLETDRLRGEEMFERRNNINQSISNHLNDTGNHDLSKKLNESRMQYKKLQDIYYNPYINNAIVKMVDKKTRYIPKNIMKVLQEDSIPMKNFINSHPGLKTAITRNAIARLMVKGALGAGGTYIAKQSLFPSINENNYK